MCCVRWCVTQDIILCDTVITSRMANPILFLAVVTQLIGYNLSVIIIMCESLSVSLCVLDTLNQCFGIVD